MARIGIDLGGTKIEVAVIDGDGRFLLRERRPTPQGDYDATVAAIVSLVRMARERFGDDVPAGMGIPGSLTRSGVVQGANSTVLIGRPLQRDVERALGTAIACENDANAMLRSETHGGAANDSHVAFGIILGTGVGGALAVDGVPLSGRARIAGEWGHNPLPWPRLDELPGPPCYCGKRGCIETWLSGPSFEREYAAARGTARSARDIVAAADDGNQIARAALEAYADRLARSLATIVNIVDPDCFVAGGGMSNVSALYDMVRERIGSYVFTESYALVFVPAAFGDSSGVRGAALLATP